MEAILEELVLLQSSSPTFRQLFESQQTTQMFIKAFRSFVTSLTSTNEIPQHHIRISEKLMHFGLTLSLDNAVAGAQKREVCLFLRSSFQLDVIWRYWTCSKTPNNSSMVGISQVQRSIRHWSRSGVQCGIALGR